MSMGLKNSEEILESVLPDINFAVNEECASTSNSEGCIAYDKLIRAGKPVFHIEYANHRARGNETVLSSTKSELRGLDSSGIENLLCLKTTLPRKRVLALDTSSKFSTVIKVLGLDGWVKYCDGIEAATVTKPSG
jgi:Glycoside-hydrolase family GH114